MKCHVDDIEVDKSSGMVDMRSAVIRDTMLGNVVVWTCLINKCIRESTFPTLLKSGTIIPLPKSGNLHSVKNWRPITLLPIIGKILERVIYRQLMYFIEEHNLINISDVQYGFQPNRSTATAVLQLVTTLYSARNRGEYALVVYLDITKAFDVVHHSRLLMKLKSAGLSISATKTVEKLSRRKNLLCSS